MIGRTSFYIVDWVNYCKEYQNRTLCEFNIDGVMQQLLKSRVIFQYGSSYFIRYSFVFDFLVGIHAASSDQKLRAFLGEGFHRRLPRVVEVMAAVALDPTFLIETFKASAIKNAMRELSSTPAIPIILLVGTFLLLRI